MTGDIGCVPGHPHPGESCVAIGPVARVGERVRLAETTDPHTDLRPGATGTVVAVDDADTVHVLWDSGQTLGLIAGEDRWEVFA
ncbi:DUF4314 domain-containing protein [Microbacterium lacticum]|uniref:Uncharacterized protein DUF4314 n=1 Tax=Microbacterium lacticum TaxID=33885 RepID=A0A4Y3UJD2_9MICO|nr:DUF4314 domain-containing protein [Microbacterium lacticum]TQN00742.1 uncharacterized protein DUF4314 [Microbacterium lacticum]GEB94174.1 hypothetical protein MLA01_03930 [Microbacterium lacticum]GGN13858.1 hypothetical protein GCM10009724_04080 [Microbacterium lacticum]